MCRGPWMRALGPHAWIYCSVRKSVAILEAVIACVRAQLLRGSGKGERKRSHFPMFQIVAYKLGAKGAAEIIHARAPLPLHPPSTSDDRR